MLGNTRFISHVEHDISHLFATLVRYLSTLLTTLNIPIQTIDCNNLQNSYVLRILCFWGEGDWLGVGGWGYETFHLL